MRVEPPFEFPFRLNVVLKPFTKPSNLKISIINGPMTPLALHQSSLIVRFNHPKF
jgi:hypothetical protein